jgi:hypothetical protein
LGVGEEVVFGGGQAAAQRFEAVQAAQGVGDVDGVVGQGGDGFEGGVERVVRCADRCRIRGYTRTLVRTTDKNRSIVTAETKVTQGV